MNRALATGTISGDLISAPDYIFFDGTVPQNDSTLSAGKLLGMTQDSIEVVGRVDTEVELADTKTFSVTLTSSATEGGTYGNAVTLYTKTASGAETIAVDTELFRYAIPKSAGPWFKVTITTDDAAAAGGVTVFPVMVA